MKTAIVIGHTSRYKGACSNYLPCEWDYNRMVCDTLSAYYDIIEHRPSDKWYTQRQKNTALKTAEYDLILELHYNAATPQANGTECLHYVTSKGGKRASQIISQEISRQFGTTIRGDKGARALYNDNQRGFGFVQIHKPIAVIVEPFFGSNKESLKFKNTTKYAMCLHEAIRKV